METHARVRPSRTTGNGAVLIRHGKHPPPLGIDLIQQLRELPQRLGAEYQIHMAVGLAHLLGHLRPLRHAAAQRDDDIRPLLLEMAQRADVAEGTILRMLSHCTGVEQDKIRLFRAVCHFISHFMQHAANALGIRFILLAAKGMRIGFGAFAAIQAGDSVNISELRLQLLFGNILLCGQFYASSHRNGVPSAVNTFIRWYSLKGISYCGRY